jgi:3-oxoacyl-[acyl-carrier protein] reductase
MSPSGPALEKVAGEIEAAGSECFMVSGSVAKRSDVERLMSEVARKYGRIDNLINNAGVVHPPGAAKRDVLELTDDDWDAVIGTNLKGAFLCAQAAAKHMSTRKKGRIVNIASVLSYRVNPPAGLLYHVSKGAILQLTAALAALLAPRGIIVSGIAPGWIETDLTREDLATSRDQITSHMITKRVGHPEDIAELALFVATEPSGYLTGQTIVFDGGQSLLAATFPYDATRGE